MSVSIWQFMLKATMTALALDSLHDSHPISVEVTDPHEIESIFDAISYSKVTPPRARIEDMHPQTELRYMYFVLSKCVW